MSPSNEKLASIFFYFYFIIFFVQWKIIKISSIDIHVCVDWINIEEWNNLQEFPCTHSFFCILWMAHFFLSPDRTLFTLPNTSLSLTHCALCLYLKPVLLPQRTKENWNFPHHNSEKIFIFLCLPHTPTLSLSNCFSSLGKFRAVYILELKYYEWVWGERKKFLFIYHMETTGFWCNFSVYNVTQPPAHKYMHTRENFSHNFCRRHQVCDSITKFQLRHRLY